MERVSKYEVKSCRERRLNTTRISLVMRLRDATDADAWSQFIEIYGPLIYRYGCRNGLQDADSADLTQEVLREVARSIGGFEYDPELGRFRNWLFVVARRALGRLHRAKQRRPLATGDSRMLQQLGQIQAEDVEAETWEAEYRQHLFRWASERIKDDFAESTWSAFWRTAVLGEKPADVAESLGMSVGSVYVSKNRVIKRLREKIAMVDDSLS